MSFTDWASALSKIVMAASSIIAILVSLPALRLALAAPPPPLPDPDPTCTAVANVEALRLELEELKQRLTDLEEWKERFVGALQ